MVIPLCQRSRILMFLARWPGQSLEWRHMIEGVDDRSPPPGPSVGESSIMRFGEMLGDGWGGLAT